MFSCKSPQEALQMTSKSLRDMHLISLTKLRMSGDRAPALVSLPSDLIQYYVSDSSPVDPASKKGYSERFIHSEIYKCYPHINSVIHSHSQAVLPYTMSGVPMRAAFHIAGFLGKCSLTVENGDP